MRLGSLYKMDASSKATLLPPKPDSHHHRHCVMFRPWSVRAVLLLSWALTFASSSMGLAPAPSPPSSNARNHDSPRATPPTPRGLGRRQQQRGVATVGIASAAAAAATIFLSGAAFAFEDGGGGAVAAAAPAPHSIERCSVSSQSPCVSTSNVRQIDLYSPPWTFATTPANEVMSRLKGAVTADPSCRIVGQDGSAYLEVEAKRNDLFGTVDRLEFVVNERDEVVTFRSAADAVSVGPDFGTQRRRLEEIRNRAGIFGVMGDTLNTADTRTSGERGNGPLGQLKAFYGLQSGAGFEDVLAE